MTSRFAGKRVVITGASAGIGAEAARLFAAEGAVLALAARGPRPLQRLADELSATGTRAVAIPTDVGVLEQCERLVERAADELGGIDVLVNNAGAHPRGPVEQRTAAELALTVDVNLRAPVVLIRLALPHLRAGGGAVVNVASLAGKLPLPEAAVYSATKMALRAFSMALAEEVRDSGVSVSLVSPGPVDTGFIMDTIDEVADIVFAQPMSSAVDIAKLILRAAAEGSRELAVPRSSAYLATLGYLFPRLRRALDPVMQYRGRRAKQRYRRAGRTTTTAGSGESGAS